MKISKTIALILGITMALSGCGSKEPISTHENQSGETSPKSRPEPIQQEAPEKEKPRMYKKDGKMFLSKEGVTIRTEPPMEGPEEVAWRFFKLQGEKKYEEAVELLSGYTYNQLKDEPDQKYLREVIDSEFVRVADITEYAPFERETEGAFDRRVIYIEVNFKLRGAIPPDKTGMRNGLNHFAVHLIQPQQDAEWKIVLLGGSPWLEK